MFDRARLPTLRPGAGSLQLCHRESSGKGRDARATSGSCLGSRQVRRPHSRLRRGRAAGRACAYRASRLRHHDHVPGARPDRDRPFQVGEEPVHRRRRYACTGLELGCRSCRQRDPNHRMARGSHAARAASRAKVFPAPARPDHDLRRRRPSREDRDHAPLLGRQRRPGLEHSAETSPGAMPTPHPAGARLARGSPFLVPTARQVE